MENILSKSKCIGPREINCCRANFAVILCISADISLCLRIAVCRSDKCRQVASARTAHDSNAFPINVILFRMRFQKTDRSLYIVEKTGPAVRRCRAVIHTGHRISLFQHLICQSLKTVIITAVSMNPDNTRVRSCPLLRQLQIQHQIHRMVRSDIRESLLTCLDRNGRYPLIFKLYFFHG